jgi:hypothetical protein
MCAPVGLICRGICVWLWWILGRFDDSTALEQLTLEQGEQLQIPQFRIQPWSAAGFLYYLRREPRPALDWANKSLAYAEQHDLPLYVALAIVVKAWAEVMLSIGDESQRTVAVETARHVIEMQSSRGIRPLLPVRLCMIGESLCRLNRHDEARQSKTHSRFVARREIAGGKPKYSGSLASCTGPRSTIRSEPLHVYWKHSKWRDAKEPRFSSCAAW